MRVPLAAQLDDLRRRVAALEHPVVPRVPAPAAHIITAVCAHFSLTSVELLGEGRNAALSNARHTGMALLRDIYGWSYPRIGTAFRRDHTTVMHACRRAARLIATDPDFAAQYDALAEVLTQQEA